MFPFLSNGPGCHHLRAFCVMLLFAFNCVSNGELHGKRLFPQRSCPLVAPGNFDGFFLDPTFFWRSEQLHTSNEELRSQNSYTRAVVEGGDHPEGGGRLPGGLRCLRLGSPYARFWPHALDREQAPMK